MAETTPNSNPGPQQDPLNNSLDIDPTAAELMSTLSGQMEHAHYNSLGAIAAAEGAVVGSDENLNNKRLEMATDFAALCGLISFAAEPHPAVADANDTIDQALLRLEGEMGLGGRSLSRNRAFDALVFEGQQNQKLSPIRRLLQRSISRRSLYDAIFGSLDAKILKKTNETYERLKRLRDQQRPAADQ